MKVLFATTNPAKIKKTNEIKAMGEKKKVLY